MTQLSAKRLTLSPLTLFCLLSTTVHATTPYLWVDYLLWKAQEDHLEYAGITTGYNPFSQNFGNTTYQVALVEQPSRWNSGVRAGLGCTFRETWDASLAYTHLAQRTCSTTRTGNTALTRTADFDLKVNNTVTAVIPVAGLNGGNFYSNSVSSTWRLQFDTVDFDLGRIYGTFDCLSLNPYVSIKWARINQCQTVTSGAAFDVTFSKAYSSSKAQRTNNFSGTGPRIGVAASWLLGHKLSLISDVSGALLTGKTGIRTAVQLTGAANPGIIIADCKRNTRLAFQLLLGFEYEWCVCDYTTLALRAGYEAQYWPTQWHVPVSVSSLASPCNGDLAFHGFTFGLAARF